MVAAPFIILGVYTPEIAIMGGGALSFIIACYLLLKEEWEEDES